MIEEAQRELLAHEVLVVDRDEKVQRGLIHLLSPAGLHVTGVAEEAKACDLLGVKFFGVVVVDLDTPTPGAGIGLVRKAHALSPASSIVVLTPRKTFDGAVEAFRAGAQDVVIKAPDQVAYLKQHILDAAGDLRRGHGALFAGIRELLDDSVKRLMTAERRVHELEGLTGGRTTGDGRAPERMRGLVIDADDRLFKALVQPGVARGFSFLLAQTGGEALDRVTNSSFHLAFVGPRLSDLPGTMVLKALKAQAPELIVIAYELGGRLEIVETTRNITVIDHFHAAQQLVDRLDELAQAHGAKQRERQYLNVFRERHYEYLRRLNELKKKLEIG